MRWFITAAVLTSFALPVAILACAADDAPIIPKDATFEKLWSDGEFTEGPAYGTDRCIYFSDIGNRSAAAKRQLDGPRTQVRQASRFPRAALTAATRGYLQISTIFLILSSRF